MFKVYPYKKGSRSARRLAAILSGKVLKLDTRIIPFNWDVIINWGSSSCPYETANCRLLNKPSAVKTAANKREAFRALEAAGVSIPKFASSTADVKWTGTTVVRHKLTGHSGEGIEIAENTENLPAAPLYVEYVKKEDEYRIHVVGDEITTIQRKGLRSDFDGEPNWKVRNHCNGFVFVRNGDNGDGITPPESVLEQARLAIKALGLDFGAVDVIYNRNARKAYVLEVNTAPGMEGSTIQEYADGFKKLIGDRK